MPGPSACIKEAEGMGTGMTWMRETDRSRYWKVLSSSDHCDTRALSGIPSQESKARELMDIVVFPCP